MGSHIILVALFSDNPRCSVKELELVVESSYHVFDRARNAKISELIFSLMCHSASFVLHAIAQVDEATTKDSENIQHAQWNNHRSKTFQEMEKALHDWIVRVDVIGGSVIGGSMQQYSLRRKYKGKEELQVYYSATLHLYSLVMWFKLFYLAVLECTVIH
jgi:hypothetical protein